MINWSSETTRLLEIFTSWAITLFDPSATEFLSGISPSVLEGTFSSVNVDDDFSSPFASLGFGTFSCLAFSSGSAAVLLLNSLVGLEFANFRCFSDNWESNPNTSFLGWFASLSNSSKTSLNEITTVFLDNIFAFLFHDAFLLS